MGDSHNNLVAATMARWISWALRVNSEKALSDIQKIAEGVEGIHPELVRAFVFFDITIALAWNLSWRLRPTLHPHDAQLPSPQPTKEELEDIQSFVKQLEKFCQDNVDGGCIDREEKIPKEVFDGLRKLEVFSLTAPQEYGGMGVSSTFLCQVLGVISRICASTDPDCSGILVCT